MLYGTGYNIRKVDMSSLISPDEQLSSKALLRKFDLVLFRSYITEYKDAFGVILQTEQHTGWTNNEHMLTLGILGSRTTTCVHYCNIRCIIASLGDEESYG